MKKISIGLVGLGRAGWGMHRHELLELMPDKFEINAVCDIKAERTAFFAEQYPGVHTYNYINDLLKDDSIELVVIAVPSRLHVNYACRALESGKYVLIEKPLAMNDAGIKQLEAADKAHPGKLFCRQNRRFESCFNHVREIIDSGVLGDVYEIKLNRQSFSFRADWQTIKSCGGGMLNNWGPHLVDHALQFLNYDIADIWSDLRNTASLGDAEDYFKVIFRDSKGKHVDCEVGGGVAMSEPVYVVHGTRGSLISQDESTIQLKYLEPGFQVPADAKASPESPEMNQSFSGSIPPQWVEKEFPVAPSNGWDMDHFYLHVWNTLRENIPFPIANHEAFAVARIIDSIKSNRHPQFKSPDDLLDSAL